MDQCCLPRRSASFVKKPILTLDMLNGRRTRGDRHGRFRQGPLLSELSRHYPFDRIKLVGSFISDLADKTNSRVIVRAIRGIGGQPRDGNNAEGSKTQEQLDYVKRVGCTEGQGYLLGKPQPAKDVRALLASQPSQPRAAAAQTEPVAD
jgi:predicted signal transduction protein with EAL and GGDEF domain